MGSFDYTCAVSGLPIHSGNKVRYILLTQNPYHKGDNACYSTDIWFPRVFPIKAEYNDYGSVDKIQEGFQRQLWLDGFQNDLIEKGVGNNSCHDVPVRKDMTFDELLAGLYEGRIFVTRRCTADESPRAREVMDKIRADEYSDPGIPTLANVEKCLQDAKLDISSGMGQRGYQIDEQMTGAVRVRWEGVGEKEWGQDEKFLSEAQEALSKEFATMLTVGSGTYARSCELLIRPKPGTKTKEGHIFHIYPLDPSKELQVRQAMIREDVWQSLLKLTFETYDYDSKKTIPFNYEHIRLKVLAAWEQEKVRAIKRIEVEKRLEALKGKEGKEVEAERQDLSFKLHFELSGRDDHRHVIESSCANLPYAFNWKTNWKLALDGYHKGKITEEEMEVWLPVVAESIFISYIFSWTRYCWRPSESCGPQFGEYGMHAQMLTAFAQIAKRIYNKERKDREEDEVDMQKYLAQEKAEKAKKREQAKAKKAKK